MSAQVSARLWAPKGQHLTAFACPRALGHVCGSRLQTPFRRQTAWHGASTAQRVLPGKLGRRRAAHLDGRAAIAVCAAGDAAQDAHMQDQLASAGPALGPSSSPQPQTPGLKRKLPWLPSAHDFTRLWGPALVLIGLTCTFDARGLAYLISSVNLHLLLSVTVLAFLYQRAHAWVAGLCTVLAFLCARVYAVGCCGQGLTKVVLVKSWLRIALGLPLQLYRGINTPSGAVFFGCMHGLLSWTGKFLLARAALKALVASRQAQSQKAAVSTASQEVETAKHPVLAAQEPSAVESFDESTVRLLEATSGSGSSIMLGPEEQQVPAGDAAAPVDAEPQEEGRNSLEARLLYVQQGIDRLETEATFIKEDQLRHNWNPADLRRWLEAVARLDSLRQEMAALTAGAPASSVGQDHSQSSGLTEEVCSPEIVQLRVPVVLPGNVETGPSPDSCQADDEANSTPVRAEAEVQTEGSAAGAQPAVDEPGLVHPTAMPHQSPEEQKLPEAEAAQAAEPFAGSTDSEAVSEGSHSAEYEALDEEDPDGRTILDLSPKMSDISAQHKADSGTLGADSRALFVAVRLGNCHDVERLLSAGCDLADVQDADGRTPAYIAAEMGHVDIVELLVEHDADLSAVDKRGYTALYAAALAGQRDAVKALLAAGADYGEAPSPLHFVKDPGVLALLLEDGAEVDAATEDGDTPLLAAVSRGYLEAAQTLLAYGAYGHLSDECSPLKRAANQGDAGMARLMLRERMRYTEEDYRWETIVIAAKEGNAKVMQAVLDAEEMHQHDFLEMAIITAAKCNHAECMAALLAARGEQHNTIDGDCNGFTPLMVAAAFGSLEVLRLLLTAGADVGACSVFEGLTALHLAAIFGHIEVAHALLEHGACAAVRDGNGHTAAELASIFGHDALAATLASAPAAEVSITREDRPHMGNLTEGARSPDIMQQESPRSRPGNMEAGPTLDEGQLNDRAAGMPVETPGAMQTEGSAAGMQPVVDEPGLAHPAGTLCQSPEEQQLPEPEAAQATEPSASSSTIGGVSEGGHPAEYEALDEEDPDSSTTLDLTLKKPRKLAQHNRELSSWDAVDRALLQAVRLNNRHEAEGLLDAGCDADAQDADGRTPLYIAAEMGHVDIVELLVEHDANLSVVAKRGYTALYAAALAGHPDIVKALLAAGAHHGAAPSPLHFVKDPGVLALLLEDGADVYATIEDGDTPLLAALSRGYMEAAQTLLAYGAYHDVDDESLHLKRAANHGNAGTVSLMLREGMRFMEEEHKWETLVIAVKEGNARVTQAILDADKTLCYETLEVAMIAAAKCNHADCMATLLAARGKQHSVIDGQDCYGFTPLVVAAAFGSLEVLRLLLAAGADANLGSQFEGLTALHLAAIFGHAQVAHALLEHGACLAMRDSNGHTAAELARIFSQDALASVLASAMAAEVSIGNICEDRSQSNLTEEAGTPAILQQRVTEVMPDNMATGLDMDEAQQDDMAAGMPAGKQAEVQAHPADVLGNTAETQPAGFEPSTVQPEGQLHQPREGEDLSQLKTAKAAEIVGHLINQEVVSEDDSSAVVAIENLLEEYADDSGHSIFSADPTPTNPADADAMEKDDSFTVSVIQTPRKQDAGRQIPLLVTGPDEIAIDWDDFISG